MAKGKITISNQYEEQPVAQQRQNNHKNHQKKMKNKIKKQKKRQQKIQQKPSLLQQIVDRQQQSYQQQSQKHIEQQQQSYYQQKRSLHKNTSKRIVLDNKVKLRNLTICFPDSILQIPQSSALRAYFISQVARISSIFKVDQIVILKDHGYVSKSQKFSPPQYIARNLQYLQTPQYLRKHLFKMHPDLQNAGLMNPIQCHHHLKANDVCQYRQGVALDRPTKAGMGSWVDIGLQKQARMDVMVLPGTRVTLKVKNYDDPTVSFYEAQAISKKQPRQQGGYYWGYDVRIANNFKEMINDRDYDVKIICNHHEKIQQLPNISDFNNLDLQDQSVIIFFSGTDNLSTLIQRDQNATLSVSDILKKFDYSLKFQNFGVQKLRMQEQLFMGLSKLSNYVD